MAPIHDAAEDGDLAEVKRLVEEEGVNPEEPSPSNGNTVALHYAAWKGRENVVTYLLETCGVDVNLVDDGNFTALYCASSKNHVSSIRLLSQHGADPNIVDDDGDTPLMIAAQNGHLDPMTLLLEDGRCNLEMKKTDTGDTAILLAADHSEWDCVKLLLSYHASPIVKKRKERKAKTKQ
jgi:ankyrin repeat protein